MAIRRAVLLIADIGGYTHYMSWNRLHLAHAQQAVAGLLEAVIDAGKGLKLAKLEGDAAFFWAPNGDARTVCERLPAMRQPFLARKERFQKDALCDCASCSQLGKLSLKFVAHVGEVAEQRVKRRTELAGLDVILVHRMLKNSVPIPEYVLMTDVVAECLEESMRQLSKPLVHHFEGIGETSTFYLDLATADVAPSAPARGTLSRLSLKLNLEMKTLPFMVGIKKPAVGFRNLGRAPEQLAV
ncbi:DUF2652 domain-containing protein [Mycobacterium kubicae]|uniref:DUF2652 domain-containing protein n=1 Tax=Mycobacterium kubicae TaxID=120959 RepID=UPI001641F3C0|nr:DUF2652 domain-containing protein [Mycobacterium kubicae]QNI06052.1 DUF2652 domain-containing protein [Mycobacterium kubicae]